MRNWKKSLLLAAGLAVLIPSAAMATQKSSEQTDTVTVEVKNVKGGALNVWYNSEYPKHVYLPIGEKVTLPKGTKLYIGAYGGDWNEYFSDDKSADVDCYAKDVIIRNENEKTIEKHMKYSSNATDYIVNDNCTIEAGFTWDIYNAGKGDYVTRLGYAVLQDGDASIDSPGIVHVKLKASKDGKEIPLSEVPGLQFGSKVNNEALPSYIDQFEFTEDGIKSKTELPIGYYRIPFCYRWTDEYESFEDGHAGFYVGKMVGVYLPEMARYKSENGEEQYLRHTYSESLTTLKNPNVEDVYTNSYFDAEKFTINDLVKLAQAVDYSKWDEICGYTRTNEFVDSDGNELNNSNEKISKLKDEMYPVYKNGNKTFKAVTVEKAVPGRIHYYNSVLKENGKRYYVDSDGKIARNGWNGVWGGSDSKVFSDEDGFIVTNGIAGISMDDEEGLWLVKDNGLRDENLQEQR